MIECVECGEGLRRIATWTRRQYRCENSECSRDIVVWRINAGKYHTHPRCKYLDTVENPVHQWDGDTANEWYDLCSYCELGESHKTGHKIASLAKKLTYADDPEQAAKDYLSD